MNKIDRRKFLQYSSSVLASASMPAFWVPRVANSDSGAGRKKLVIFFMNGGNDGQNTIVPIRTYDDVGTEINDFAGDWLAQWNPNNGDFPPFTGPNSHSQYDHYRALRRDIHLRKVAEGSHTPILPLNVWSGGPALGNRMPMSGYVSSGFVEFGMNPAMQALVDIWDAGDLAIFPAAHCGPDPNRSHFFQTEYFGHGLYNTTEGEYEYGDGRGWVGRYFDQKYLPGGIVPDRIEAFDFEGGYFPLMDGSIPILAVSNPASVLNTSEENLLSDVIGINQARAADPNTLQGEFALTQQALFDKLAKLDGVTFPNNTDDYNNANPGLHPYPNSTLGRNFMRAAAMIKDPIVGAEIEVINLDRGSFDTHGNQVEASNTGSGSHANTLGDCANSIKAFYEDVNAAGCGDDVITLVMSEFGRTADENGNRGTDHAHASCFFAIGNSVNPGLYGNWPGTADRIPDAANPGEFISDLNGANSSGGGRKWLNESVDYRDILSELIGYHLNDPASSGIDAAQPFNATGNSEVYTLPLTRLGFVGTSHS